MKYTRKMQSGGLLAYQPTPMYPPDKPTTATPTTPRSSSTSLLDDDIKDALLKGGLSNETNALLSELSAIENQSNPFLNQTNRLNTLSLIGRINELQRNKEMWTQSYNTSKELGGLGEIAVGNSGELYVKDNEGSLKAVTISDYKKNRDKYRALSVAELLEERNSNPGLIGNNNIFNVANNSISIGKISDYAQTIVKNLGTESSKSQSVYSKEDADRAIRTIQSTGKTPSEAEMKGFAILEEVRNSPSKYSQVLSESSSERNNAIKAVKYIWTTLGTNAQNKLAAQAAINNVDPYNLLLDLVTIGTNESIETTVTPIEEGKATGTGSGSGTGYKNLTETSMLMRGTLGSGQRFIFNDPEVDSKFAGLMTGTMAFTTADNNNPMGPTTLFGVLKQGGWERLVDTNNIYFGNKRVENYQLSDIIFDGSSDIARVYLPVNNDGSPDNDSLVEYKKVMDEYNENKDNMTIGEIQKLFRNSGFNVKVNPDKTVEVSAMAGNLKPFLIAYAYTIEGSDLVEDNVEEAGKNAGGLRKLNKAQSEGLKAVEDIAWTIGSGKNARSLKPKTGFLGGIGGTSRYKGIVYMPERPSAAAIAGSMSGAGPRAIPQTEEEVMSNINNTSGVPFVQTDKSLLDG